MKKRKTNVAKEIIVFMVLLILIMLILAVTLYEFIPANVNIPESIEYSSDSTTTAIKQEIMYTNGGDLTADQDKQDDFEPALKSYSIDSFDLTVYGQKNLYNSGNSNPFDYATDEPVQDGGTTDGQTQNQGSTTTNNTTSTQAGTTNTTTGTFFENPASK